MDVDEHIEEAFRFLQRARLFTAAPDDLARSEMLWCAAAHIVKAVAVQRGWRNDSHNDLFDVAARINRTIGYPQALAHFRSASSLHSNMYRRFILPHRLDTEEAKVRRFVNRIAGAIGG